MSADDILFEPIGLNKGKLLIDQQMIDAVKIALTGVSAIEFFVDSAVDIDTYDMVADLIEQDPQIIKYTDALARQVTTTEQRPAGALTIKDVMRRMHAGEDHFYFCARANGTGVHKHKFTNWFSIDTQIPIVHVEQNGSSGGYFEMWIMGLMSNYLGYGQYYCFADWVDADKYYGLSVP